ncbi:hypothetical protein [Streptomyces sp. NPDC048111]|uniref:hypothetical protein n=1 Tax=Streptomyces sp. NPDC048111 TaxID=3365500 RepID=UPI003717BC20
MVSSERSGSAQGVSHPAADGVRRPSAAPGQDVDQFPFQVAELATRLGGILGLLRTLDLEGIAPASVFRAAGHSPAPRQESGDAAV